MSDNNNNGNFFYQYRGAIIGLIIAIVLLAFDLYRVILIAIAIIGAMFIGNYIQNNKQKVKENLKKFIDKM